MSQPASNKNFNHSLSTNTFVPMQAIAPTPELYDELTGDCMPMLASATLAQLPPIPDGSLFHDNGCGTGAATAAIALAASSSSINVSIQGTDINEDALNIYRSQIKEKNWHAEAINMDSSALSFPDETFTHSIANLLLFVLPDDGVAAMKETYRTLKPGGMVAVNTWAYVPNMGPLNFASKATRPTGTPSLRPGMDKWQDLEFLKSVVVRGGFEESKVEMRTAEVYVKTPSAPLRYVNMLWSFIGGTGEAGWLESDEGNWDRAIEVLIEELKKTDGFGLDENGNVELKFVANIVVATK